MTFLHVESSNPGNQSTRSLPFRFLPIEGLVLNAVCILRVHVLLERSIYVTAMSAARSPVVAKRIMKEAPVVQC